MLRQCHQLRPDDSLVCLYAAKLCFNNLHMVNYAKFFVTRNQSSLLSLRRGTSDGSRALEEEGSAGNDGKKKRGDRVSPSLSSFPSPLARNSS